MIYVNTVHIKATILLLQESPVSSVINVEIHVYIYEWVDYYSFIP